MSLSPNGFATRLFLRSADRSAMTERLKNKGRIGDFSRNARVFRERLDRFSWDPSGTPALTLKI